MNTSTAITGSGLLTPNAGIGRGPGKLLKQAGDEATTRMPEEIVEFSGGHGARETILPPEPNYDQAPVVLETAAPGTSAASKSTQGSSDEGLRFNNNGTLAILESGPVRQRDEKFLSKYGPWGVVTGASQGVGAEYARQLAEKGMNVVLVARNAGKLQQLAQELRAEYGVDVKVSAQDLGTAQGLEQVKAATDGLEVGLLVNNAGSWQFGSFVNNDIDKDLQSVALNVEAPMVLSHHFAGLMANRGRGGVINVGSGAGLHGVPGQAAYSATKGFMQNFTESLYRELKPKGVDVIITNPGPIKGDAMAYDASKLPLPLVEAETVVKDSIKNLGKKSSTIPGWLNKIGMGIALRAMPRDLLASIAGYILENAEKPT